MPVIFSPDWLDLSLSLTLPPSLTALRTNDTGHRDARREAREAGIDVDRPQQFSLDSHLQ